MKVESESEVAQSCPILWDPMNRSTPGLPVYHQLPEFTQTHVHQFMANRWETVETVSDFILGGSKSLQMVIPAMKLKDAYSLEGKL